MDTTQLLMSIAGGLIGGTLGGYFIIWCMDNGWF